MILGIDLGGTNISLGLVDGGNVVRMVSVPSFASGSTLEQTLVYLSEKIEAFIVPEVDKIGIGVPTVVDVERGIVYDAANIPSWKEVHLKEILEDRFGVQVSVNNDANCYAMGVYGIYPEDSKPDVLVTVTLGTGMGVGIVDHGHLFCGVNCGAGELGYISYKDGCLEEYCSKQFFAMHGAECHEAADAAFAGDPAAVELFNEFGRHLGHALTFIMYSYDPSHIVLGGGIANAMPLFRESMMQYLKEKFPFRSNVDRLVVAARTNNEIPVIGASLI